jgi:hypothetical protein
VDCFRFLIVLSGYGDLLTRKSLRLLLIIQIVNAFILRVVEHELRTVELDAREDAIFPGFDRVDVVSFGTDAIANLTGENFVVPARKAGGVLSGEASTQHQ